MNVERVKQLRDFIESGAHPWGIDSTETCFVGQARAMGSRGRSFLEFLDGLSEEEGDLMITPSGWLSHPRAFTRERAVEMLDRLLQTGKVDWG